MPERHPHSPLRRPGGTPKSSLGPQQSTAVRIAGVYLVFGLLWIWLSDGALAWQGGLSIAGFWAAAGKGTIFVLLSSLLVFWLSRREFRSFAASNSLLRAVTEGTTDAVFVKDRAGKYLLFNEAASQFVGQPVSAVLGQDDTALFDPASARQIMERDRRIMADGEPDTAEEVLPASGVLRTFQATKAPFRDEHGNVVGIIGVSRDITDRKRAEQELRAERDRFEKIIEAVPVVICTFELRPDGSIRMPFASRRIEHIYGVGPADLARDASPIFDLIHVEDIAQVRETFADSVKSMSDFRCEYRLHSPNRGEIWVERCSCPVKQPDGSTLWHGYIADVTERRQAADTLRENKTRLREAQRIARLGSWAWEPATGKVWWSKPIYALFGLAEDVEPSFDVFLSIVHPDDRAVCHARVQKVLAGADGFANEIRIIRPDGRELWVYSEGRVTRDTAGNVLRIEGVDQDITDRKSAENRLRESEERLRLFIDHAPAALAMFDRELRFVAVSNRWATDFGLNKESLGGRTLYEVFPEMSGDWQDIHHRVLAGEVFRSDENRFDRADGSALWLRWEARPWKDAQGNVSGIALFTEDITQRHLTEEALRNSEERFRKLIEVLPDAVFIVAHERISYCNPAFLRLMGATDPSQLLGKTKFDLVAPEYREMVRARMKAMQATGAPAPLLREQIIRLDGRIVPVYVMTVPVMDHAEERFLVVMHDLTDRERSVELLRSVMGSVDDTILTIDQRGVIQSANSAAERAFGYTEAELLGQNVRMLMPDPYRDEHDSYLANYLRTGIAKVIGIGREALALRKDGSQFPIDLTVTEFSLNGERRFTGVIRDITDRKRLEEQFRQAQKMEAVGQLAGGVAHDFNNLLTIITGYSEMLLDGEIENNSMRELVEEINKAGHRSAGLTRQLLAFSRKQVLAPKVLDLNEVVRNTEKMLRRVIGEDVKLITIMSEIDCVLADPGQLEQVLLNLAVNARDAMPQGGELIIETSNVELDANYAETHAGVRAGKYVLLCVSDSGHGISVEIRQHLFEPFFTTKEVGKGTGLGLAVVHGIVKQSEGHIQVYSEPGSGTAFKIYLPAILNPVGTESPTSGRHHTAQGTETILLVEDEEVVRKLAQRSLTHFGYSVLSAASPAEAINLSSEHQGPIHLLLTDVVMPQLNGRRLAELLTPERPEMKVLYMSGYTDDAMMRQGVLEADVHFLNKPFVPSALGMKVREVLDG